MNKQEKQNDCNKGGINMNTTLIETHNVLQSIEESFKEIKEVEEGSRELKTLDESRILLTIYYKKDNNRISTDAETKEIIKICCK